MSDGAKALKEMEGNPHFNADVLEPLRAQGAPRDFREIVAQVAHGDVPDAAQLEELGSGLERAYGVRPQPTGGGTGYQREMNLLEHALQAGNLPAVRAILQAGFDPNLAAEEFARASAPNPSGPPDWTTSPPFLEAFLEFGGNIDYAREDSEEPMITRAAAPGNYEGVKFLLTRGADPWIRVRALSWEQDPAQERAVPNMIKGGETQLELFGWLHDEGYMDDAPQDVYPTMYDRHLAAVDKIVNRQTLLDDRGIELLRDGFAASLTRQIDYRRADREAFVARLSGYLEERTNRP
ncbi:MAG: hypothetical protein JXQ91_15640 [Vannielia sp.]|uniref:hypothetical protein n=1 Tax=Vannielia sp. TaxID=2813045 RepID=UPI003B8AAAD6